MSKTKSKYFREDEQLKLIGEKIRTTRLSKGYTQKELAFECGEKDWTFISRMERGVVNFTISYLFVVAKALGISPKDLLP